MPDKQRLSFFPAFSDIALHFLKGMAVDQWPHKRVRGFRRTYRDALDRLQQSPAEFVQDAFENDHPRAGRAFLPLIAEAGFEDPLYSLVNVRGVINNNGVLAPHLRDNTLYAGLTGKR